MARSLPPDELASDLTIVQTTLLKDVEIDVDPARLRIDLRPPTFGVSPDRVDPLWHTPPNWAEVPSITVVLSHRQDGKEPRVVTLRNATTDGRFEHAWGSWSFVERPVMESEGGVGAEAQDAVRGDTLSLLIKPGEERRARLEFAASLVEGVAPAKILHRIEASCDGEVCELTTWLLLEHPDSWMLEQLPSIYQEAMAEMRADLPTPNIPFFERYLIGLQDAIDPLREALKRMDALFGPYSAPPDFLVWLAAWVCMPLDASWPEIKRRRLISEAVELFRWRGTKRGLSRFLEIYTGVKPSIQDRPQQGARLGLETLIGAPSAIVGDVPDCTFTVTLGVPNPAAIDEEAVRRIIEAEKPAHTAYRLLIVRREAQSAPSALDGIPDVPKNLAEIQGRIRSRKA